MTGWLILKTSIGHLRSKFKTAIKISFFLVLAGYVLRSLVFFIITGEDFLLASISASSGKSPGATYFVAALLTLAIHIFIASWIAVSWHRFVLLGELKSAAIPYWQHKRIIAYIWRGTINSFLLVLALIIPAVIIGIVLSTGLLPSQLGITLTSLILGVFAFYLFLRISLTLPAIALDKPTDINASWLQTDSVKSGILLLSLVMVGVSLISEKISGLFIGNVIARHLVLFLVEWVVLLISVSILTTLYGHLIQDRKLNKNF